MLSRDHCTCIYNYICIIMYKVYACTTRLHSPIAVHLFLSISSTTVYTMWVTIHTTVYVYTQCSSVYTVYVPQCMYIRSVVHYTQCMYIHSVVHYTQCTTCVGHYTCTSDAQVCCGNITLESFVWRLTLSGKDLLLPHHHEEEPVVPAHGQRR